MVLFSHLQVHGAEESALRPAVWLQCYANSPNTHLSHITHLFHSYTRFILIPLSQDELLSEKLCQIGNGS